MVQESIVSKFSFVALALGSLALCACADEPETNDAGPGADAGDASSCDLSAYQCCFSERLSGGTPRLCGQDGLPQCPGFLIRIPATSTCASLAPDMGRDMGNAPMEDASTADAADVGCGAEVLTCCDLETQEPADAICRDGLPACPTGTNLPPIGEGCANFAASIEGRIEAIPLYRPDAQGTIYVVLFDREPYAFGEPASNAKVVAAQVLADEDLSQPESAAWYTLKGITPRAEPYYIDAFLDVDNSSDPSDPATARPSRGDLITTDPFTLSTPNVVLDRPGKIQFGLELNATYDPIY